jgi:branched-chain amino acid transport system ATP-binding protein
MLEVRDLDTYYGSSHVVQGLSLRVAPGEVVTLLGRNGAGKTTTLRSLVGLTPPKRGTITLDGRNITRSQPHVVSRLGLAFVPSGRRVFGTLTVSENLKLALYSNRKRAGEWTIDRVHATFPKLATIAKRQAGLLSGGEQQMLKLGRALLSNPTVLLLDEPTEGLSPAVVSELGSWLEQLRQENLGVLLTEQNAVFALRHADRGYILEKGRCRAEGSCADLADGSALRTYLGVGGDGHWTESTRSETR